MDNWIYIYFQSDASSWTEVMENNGAKPFVCKQIPGIFDEYYGDIAEKVCNEETFKRLCLEIIENEYPEIIQKLKETDLVEDGSATMIAVGTEQTGQTDDGGPYVMAFEHRNNRIDRYDFVLSEMGDDLFDSPLRIIYDTETGYELLWECMAEAVPTMAFSPSGESIPVETAEPEENCVIAAEQTVEEAPVENSDFVIDQFGELKDYIGKEKNVIIPNGVKKISKCAFYECGSLTSVTIPDSVTEIGEYAFGSCGSLTSITIPNSVTKIGNDAFYGCASLMSITIPEGVTEIGEYAFGKCTGLTSITLPKKTKKISEYAFWFCGSLTSITIPDGVTEIGGYAFYECGSLTSITIPDGVTEIGGYAFYECGSLTSITIPDSVTEIGEYAFRDCGSLTSITIPDGVTEIGNDTFSYCTSLTSITIPDSVTEIGEYAFFGCARDLATIYGAAGSYAEEYAKSKGFNFEAIA